MDTFRTATMTKHDKKYWVELFNNYSRKKTQHPNVRLPDVFVIMRYIIDSKYTGLLTPFVRFLSILDKLDPELRERIYAYDHGIDITLIPEFAYMLLRNKKWSLFGEFVGKFGDIDIRMMRVVQRHVRLGFFFPYLMKVLAQQGRLDALTKILSLWIKTHLYVDAGKIPPLVNEMFYGDGLVTILDESKDPKFIGMLLQRLDELMVQIPTFDYMQVTSSKYEAGNLHIFVTEMIQSHLGDDTYNQAVLNMTLDFVQKHKDKVYLTYHLFNPDYPGDWRYLNNRLDGVYIDFKGGVQYWGYMIFTSHIYESLLYIIIQKKREFPGMPLPPFNRAIGSGLLEIYYHMDSYQPTIQYNEFTIRAYHAIKRIVQFIYACRREFSDPHYEEINNKNLSTFTKIMIRYPRLAGKILYLILPLFEAKVSEKGVRQMVEREYPDSIFVTSRDIFSLVNDVYYTRSRNPQIMYMPILQLLQYFPDVSINNLLFDYNTNTPANAKLKPTLLLRIIVYALSAYCWMNETADWAHYPSWQAKLVQLTNGKFEFEEVEPGDSLYKTAWEDFLPQYIRLRHDLIYFKLTENRTVERISSVDGNVETVKVRVPPKNMPEAIYQRVIINDLRPYISAMLDYLLGTLTQDKRVARYAADIISKNYHPTPGRCLYYMREKLIKYINT